MFEVDDGRLFTGFEKLINCIILMLFCIDFIILQNKMEL